MAAADLDGDGTIEVVVTTTQTVPTADGGAQVFVLNPDGSSYQPAGGHVPAWPRYNHLPGPGNDADRNGPGHSGFGCYGLNVAIGDIDDDPAQEIIVTYDNHFIQAFDHDGVAIDSSDYFTNRTSPWVGNRLTWGQFIRWADPQVEHDHYHLHSGQWPHPDWTEWLQWTASPPSVADLDRDGKNEVIAVPNVERHVPYVTQAYAIMVLEGAHGDASRSARRLAGWEVLPRGDAPIVVDGWYPPYGVPAPTYRQHQRRLAPRDPGLAQRWLRVVLRRHRESTLENQLPARPPDHVQLGGHGCRPQPRRRTRAAARDVRRPRRARLRPPHHPVRPRVRSSTTSLCPAPATTATATEPRRRPLSATSTATASSRSSSRPSTTGSTCSPCRDLRPTACCGRRPAADRSGPGRSTGLSRARLSSPTASSPAPLAWSAIGP